MRRLLVVVLLVGGGLLVAGPAQAHVGGGRAGSDFDGRVLAVTPSVPGVSVRVLSFGDDVELRNASSTEVMVPGYSDEPYLRIGRDGVWRNRNSPATYINLSLDGRATLPSSADPHASPDWEQVSTETSYVWHDHRTHWMSAGELPPVVAADPSRPHQVFAWSIPVFYGSQEVVVTGELTWSPPPSPWVVWPVCVLLLMLGVAAGVGARSPRPLGVLMTVGAAAAVWHAATTPAPAASVGSHLGALVSALLPAALVLLIALAGVRAALRGRGVMTGLMALLIGWLLLVEGLPDVDVLWTSHALSNGPGFLARAAVAVMVALGAGLVVGGAFAARRFRDAARPVEVRSATQPV